MLRRIRSLPATAPIVSVIIATYNRSYTLRHAIQSVLNSTLTEWELIVVGDACTDDTAECVTSFNDTRIQFINLSIRCGDQSAPNNHGITLSRGRFIAFLNHDDLYSPNHLQNCVDEIQASGADLVWVPCAYALPNPAPSESARPFVFTLSGVPLGSAYSPLSFYFASSWVLRRTLADRVGKWTEPERLYVTPSQDWLFRAWRSGACLRFLPKVSVVVVPAGPREGSYLERESPEHDWIAAALRDNPERWQLVLEEAAIGSTRQYMSAVNAPSSRLFVRLLRRPVYALLIALGIHPLSLPVAIFHGRRGNHMRKHWKTTGSH
jgi:glycosyltransferase involved in cell wall biosynthesis